MSPNDRATKTATRKPGTIATSDRFMDATGQLWKLTRKGWRVAKPKESKNG